MTSASAAKIRGNGIGPSIMAAVAHKGYDGHHMEGLTSAENWREHCDDINIPDGISQKWIYRPGHMKSDRLGAHIKAEGMPA